MPYPSAYEAEPLDSAKRRALGTHPGGATPPGGFQGRALNC
jgi:hypothetical protein